MSTHDEVLKSIESLGETAMKIRAQRDALWEVLADCLEYFEDRADADHNGDRYVPNREMVLQMAIQRVMERGQV